MTREGKGEEGREGGREGERERERKRERELTLCFNLALSPVGGCKCRPPWGLDTWTRVGLVPATPCPLVTTDPDLLLFWSFSAAAAAAAAALADRVTLVLDMLGVGELLVAVWSFEQRC